MLAAYVESSASQRGPTAWSHDISLRDDAVRANRKRNDDVAIDDEENAVFLSHIQIENLMTMPENTSEFVTAQRRVPPVRRKKSKFRACGAFNLRRKIPKVFLESNGAPIDHKSSTASSIVS